MKQLYLKELKLNVKPVAYIFSLFALMLLIPNYPIVVGVGYSMMQVHLYMQFMRENRSLEFSTTLPVKRKDIVTSTTLVIVTLQMMTTFVAAVCAVVVRIAALMGSSVYASGNLVGMDATFTFFGVMLVCLAAFNFIFITQFWKTGYKYGTILLIGVLVYCVIYVMLELVIQLVPALRNALDGYQTKTIWARLVVLAVGVVAYVTSTLLANRLAQKKFEKVSL